MSTVKETLREVREKTKSQNQEIQEEIANRIVPFMKMLRKELEKEFGRALLKNADLFDIEDLLVDAFFAGADVAKEVLTRHRHQEINRSTGELLNLALLAGERKAAEE